MNGIGLAVISALLFGAVTGIAKLLLAGAGPATVGALTYLGAGLVGLLAAARSPLPHPSASGKTDSRAIFVSALVLGAIVAPLLLMTGLQRTTASLASVIANIEGIATVGLAWLLFKERSDVTGIVCITAILAGVACFTFSEDVVATGNAGPLLVGAAYLCWAIDINLMRRVTNITAARATAIRGIAGAIVMACVALLRQETLPDFGVLAGGLLTGAVGFGISFILLLNALPSIGTAKAGAIFASAPIFSYVSSSIIEGGTLEPSGMQLIAITLIAFGVLLSGANTFISERSGPTGRQA